MTIAIQGSMIGRSDKNGPQGCGYGVEVGFTQNCVDQHGVCYERERERESMNEPIDKDIAEMEYIVRRLMPVECERLMGLPDDYTKVHFTEEMLTDELVDEFIEIKRNWDAMNANSKPVKPKSRKAMRSWLLGISTNPSDSPRYKACGNGWATNQPRWIVMNILNTFHPGWDDAPPLPTVGVFDMTHADDPGREVTSGAAPTLQARMGTGGNQVPLCVKSTFGISTTAGATVHPCQDNHAITLRSSPGGHGGVLMENKS